ncbi:hypothetical protein F4861DRAFT_489515 [Xylaria intraflava]|nr:hypothetical protein F4861DRAFT_489515 [Xylaria intraflava]
MSTQERTTRRGRDVTVDGITVNVPDENHCWHFRILYACGCLADKVIRVKKNNHHGPCLGFRCIRAYQDHRLVDQCTNCIIFDLRRMGVDIP